MRKDVLALFLRAAREHGDVSRLKIGFFLSHLVAHPDGVKWVLQENSRNYDKQTPGSDKSRAFVGNGLLASEGEFWLKQRRTMQPAFHKERIAGFGAIIAEAARETVNAWRAKDTSEGVRDVLRDMNELALRVVQRTLLVASSSAGEAGISRAVSTMMDELALRITTLVDLPDWVPTPANRRLARAIGELDAVVASVVAERRASGSRPDLLSMLLDAKDPETGRGMTDTQLRDEVMTIFVAGSETTGNALAWALALLAKHPEKQAALRDEVEAVTGAREPALEDIKQLPYVRAVVDEGLRLYPPGWFVVRRAIAADEIGGFAIPKGSLIIASPYVTHRHPAFWKDPEAFEPERFLQAQERPRFAYFPFGGGPRQCIGFELALLEMRLTLATLVKHFEFKPLDDAPLRTEAGVTLKPRGGLKLRVPAVTRL